MKIVVYGADWCPESRTTLKFLDKNKVKYEYVDIEKNPEAGDLVIELNEKLGKGPYKSIPTIVIDDFNVLSEPSNEELAEALGIDAKFI